MNESEAGIDSYSQILLVNKLIISPNWSADPLYSSWSSGHSFKGGVLQKNLTIVRIIQGDKSFPVFPMILLSSIIQPPCLKFLLPSQLSGGPCDGTFGFHLKITPCCSNFITSAPNSARKSQVEGAMTSAHTSNTLMPYSDSGFSKNFSISKSLCMNS